MMIIAAITPYLALGKSTPLILVGLRSSLLLSLIYRDYKKKGRHNQVAPKFYFILPIGNIAFMIISTMSFSSQF